MLVSQGIIIKYLSGGGGGGGGLGGAIHKGSVFEKCFLSEVITPITLNTKFAPLSPHKNISDPPTPYPLPLCVLT